jgi:transcription elongation factor S-II
MSVPPVALEVANPHHRMREKAQSKFLELLEDDHSATRLERALYNWTIKTTTDDHIYRSWENAAFRFRYSSRCNSLLQNMKHKDNPELLQKLKNGELAPAKFANMTHKQMFPAHWEKLYEQAASREIRRTIKLDAGTVDGAYECHKCKTKKTVYRQLQIRSADEPMTTFVFCLNCSHRWKFC